MRFAGEIAAVATAACWGTAANFFVTAGRRLGSVQLNRIRLLVAGVLLAATLWLVRGSPWPVWASQTQFLLLGASGLAGFAIGDSLYFRALVILGAGRAVLLLSLAPLCTAIFARWWLGETLGFRVALGMGLTLAGLATVLYGRGNETPRHAEGSAAMGVVCGVLASIGAGAGYVLSKLGLQGGLDPLSGTLIRVATAGAAVWLLALFEPRREGGGNVLRDRVALGTTLGGSIAGPFLGVTLSLFALQHTSAAVASSIFACAPLVALVIGARFHREPLTLRTVSGTLVTLAGVLALFSR